MPEVYAPSTADSLYLEEVVRIISREIGPRDYVMLEALNQTRDYIKTELESFGYSVSLQEYDLFGHKYYNVIAEMGPITEKSLVIGAHYDSCGVFPGADDNASGVAGLLMLASMLADQERQLQYGIEFVAYTLEEPPWFRTQSMGSYQHARRLSEKDRKLIGMICLESIGYYSEEPGSQHYPLMAMKRLYPDKAEFIAIISNYKSRNMNNQMLHYMNQEDIPSLSLKAPARLRGVDFSDHLNYWEFGYPAVMITDTPIYRNPNYHTAEDTMEKLDYRKMAEVVNGIYRYTLSVCLEANRGN